LESSVSSFSLLILSVFPSSSLLLLEEDEDDKDQNLFSSISFSHLSSAKEERIQQTRNPLLWDAIKASSSFVISSSDLLSLSYKEGREERQRDLSFSSHLLLFFIHGESKEEEERRRLRKEIQKEMSCLSFLT